MSRLLENGVPPTKRMDQGLSVWWDKCTRRPMGSSEQQLKGEDQCRAGIV